MIYLSKVKIYKKWICGYQRLNQNFKKILNQIKRRQTRSSITCDLENLLLVIFKLFIICLNVLYMNFYITIYKGFKYKV